MTRPRRSGILVHGDPQDGPPFYAVRDTDPTTNNVVEDTLCTYERGDLRSAKKAYSNAVAFGEHAGLTVDTSGVEAP